MPRLKESKHQQQDALFRKLVAKNMALCDFRSKKAVAECLNMTRSTFWYKVREPDKFSRQELRHLFEALHFTEEEKAAVM